MCEKEERPCFLYLIQIFDGSKVKKRELISVITGLTDPNPFFAAEFLLNSYNNTMVQNRFWSRNMKLCQLWQNISKIEQVLQNRHVFGFLFVIINLFFNLFCNKFKKVSKNDTSERIWSSCVKATTKLQN